MFGLFRKMQDLRRDGVECVAKISRSCGVNVQAGGFRAVVIRSSWIVGNPLEEVGGDSAKVTQADGIDVDAGNRVGHAGPMGTDIVKAVRQLLDTPDK